MQQEDFALRQCHSSSRRRDYLRIAFSVMIMISAGLLLLVLTGVSSFLTPPLQVVKLHSSHSVLRVFAFDESLGYSVLDSVDNGMAPQRVFEPQFSSVQAIPLLILGVFAVVQYKINKSNEYSAQISVALKELEALSQSLDVMRLDGSGPGGNSAILEKEGELRRMQERTDSLIELETSWRTFIDVGTLQLRFRTIGSRNRQIAETRSDQNAQDSQDASITASIDGKTGEKNGAAEENNLSELARIIVVSFTVLAQLYLLKMFFTDPMGASQSMSSGQ